jgi:hypothetical protein
VIDNDGTALGVWETLPDWAKVAVIGGLSLSAVGLLSSLMDGDEEEHGGGSWLGPVAGVGGLGLAAYGLSGGQPGRLLDPRLHQNLWQGLKGTFAGSVGR